MSGYKRAPEQTPAEIARGLLRGDYHATVHTDRLRLDENGNGTWEVEHRDDLLGTVDVIRPEAWGSAARLARHLADLESRGGGEA